jgi:hypothetical protein
MLIGFKLGNFRSFLHEQAFSYVTSSDRAHESTHCVRTGMKSIPRLSKSAIIFGPNGSGKTNFIVGLETLRDLVLHSTAYSELQFAERYTPFQFGPSAHLPTHFEIDVLLDNVRYRYNIAYDEKQIWSERLLVYKTGKAQRWFERSFDAASNSEVWQPFSPNFNGPREMWRKATRPKALFLTTAAQLNSEQLKPLFHWFEHCLEVIFPSDTADVARIAASVQDPRVKIRALQLLRSVGIDVEDVRVADPEHAMSELGAARNVNASHLPHVNARLQVEFLYARKGWNPVWLESEYEAAGIHRLFGLFGPLIATIDNDKLLVIDEFDANLHPLIARFLVKLVNDPVLCKGRAQLLLVSHNTTLMDLDMLRRDEIWLTELDESHASVLSTVLRSSPRKHEQIAKGYLRGRYGAVPSIRPQLHALVTESDTDLSKSGRAKFAS